MKASATKSNKTRQWKPLSQAQENALMLVLQGMTDSEVAADPTVNVSRSTVWHWRMEDVIFKAELQQRRAAIWSSTREKLRGLMAKAIANITDRIEEGSVADSWNLLRCVGLFGDGTGNAVHGAHIEHELRQQATNQARQEYDLLIQDHSPTASMKRLDWNEAVRVEEILEELRDEYSDPDE